MKYPLIIIGMFTLVGITSCQLGVKFKKVPSSEIDALKLERATLLADTIMKTLADRKFYLLNQQEAEPRMIDAFTEEVQKESYEKMSGAFGQYQGLQFDHVLRPMDGTLYEIYRFKGVFESERAQVEIRAVLNAQGKLAGFFIRPWKDQLTSL